MRTFKALLAYIAITTLSGGGLVAQETENVATLDVRPGWRNSDGTHMAGLQIKLAPGWKTYWRSPGDGGIPPRLMLEPTGNIRSVQIAWPIPEVFYQNGLRSIGYTEEVTLPLAITTLDAKADVDLTGNIEIGVCEEICIPMRFPVNVRLSAQGVNDKVIRAALASRPMSASDAGMTNARCSALPISDGLRVSARIEMPPLAETETAVIELADREIWVSEADTLREGTTLEATVELVPPDGKPFALDRSTVRITVIGAGKAVDIRGC